MTGFLKGNTASRGPVQYPPCSSGSRWKYAHPHPTPWELLVIGHCRITACASVGARLQAYPVTAKIKKQLEHRRKGLPVLVAGTDVADIGNVPGEHHVHLIHLVHGIQQYAFTQRKCNHFRHIYSFPEYRKLQVDGSTEHVVVQMCNKALHGNPFIG